ncbi:DUF3224 domain-containing protein [Actinokineospora bangkokensis]|uniref:DUF3224 domain-containing protein n=1 Tax=Actinokineospora bangkokensis TaxID=1193682 RepID=A0A1Q9LS35_9PSEU|nr:DUF3224 domain-containing protein [Actinokineospora bangkokensis]OLR94811.1 hypothetical protein BJP25_09260 [Actinokineospora bangkokensis]
MSTTVTASFKLDSWDEEEWQASPEGMKFSKAELTKTYTGGVEGSSRGQFLFAFGQGGAGYVGHEQLEVVVEGRKGTFILQHQAVGLTSDEEGGADWHIVPGTGTGDLAGIQGTATMRKLDDGSHTFSLAYEILPELV